MKNNMKLLLIALIVLILERVFDFLFSFSTGYRFYRRSDDGSGENPEFPECPWSR